MGKILVQWLTIMSREIFFLLTTKFSSFAKKTEIELKLAESKIDLKPD